MITLEHISSATASGATEPVTLAEVKAWAKVDHNDDDVLLESMIEGAREDIENETNLKLVETDFTIQVKTTESGEFFSLPGGIGSEVVVNSISPYNGEETLLIEGPGEDYKVNGGSIRMSSDGTFLITYTTGTTIPKALKESILMLIAYRYNNPGSQENQMGMPPDIKKRVEKYVQIWH